MTVAIVVLSTVELVCLVVLFAVVLSLQADLREARREVDDGDAKWDVTWSPADVNDPAFGHRGAGWQKPVAPPRDDARPGGLPPAPARRRVVDFVWPPHIVASDSEFSDFLRDLIDARMRHHARAAARTPGGRP